MTGFGGVKAPKAPKAPKPPAVKAPAVKAPKLPGGLPAGGGGAEDGGASADGVAIPRSSGYRSAVRAYAAARKLNVVATIFVVLGLLLGAGAIAGCIIVILTAKTTDARWIGGAAIVGALFWILGVLLAATWAQAYAKDVISRQPWEPK